jgi:dTDP-4-dehydrorhamnose 3,5-epimerase
MGEVSIAGISVTPLRQIEHPKGNIYHALKRSETSYEGFGEVYFSFINKGETKGWKMHKTMTLNLVVPIGAIKFVIFDTRENSLTRGSVAEIVLSPVNYQRLTVAPGLWVAFQGIGNDSNVLLNLANIEHDPNESVNLEIGELPYDWNA